MILYPGRDYSGKIYVEDIGFPKNVLEKCPVRGFSIENKDLLWMPERKNDSNKGDYGKILIIAGSKNMSGAAYFAAKAAYTMGAGLVRVLTEETNRVILQTQLPQAMISVWEEMTNEQLKDIIGWADSVVIGPGVGTREEMKNVQVEDALKHPNWSMGKKITIDSATMVNKGLEVIEAKWLFDVSYEQVEVVVQPQSLIHSMVEFKDGGIMAQLGTPDMRLPIQYALYYPERRNLNSGRVDFKTLKSIEFYEPDLENFRGLKLAYLAGKTGGSMPTVFNAANERAVAKFLDRRIGFLDITDIIEESMKLHKIIENPSVEQILEVEQETYEFIESRW
ncbi:MAG: 1-deoxy-D-xylulose-5-phosphate reductoisomerase [Lachnospiraceae bacterium]|nr:1-deoxy-D-xylulose-5-phosphate reductoisomerase [Lachnospiraceae bacterium]